MTDFLRLASVPVPVADGSADQSIEEIGGRSRAFDAGMRSQVRAEKRQWQGRTTPLTQAESELFAALIQGRGNVASFDVDLDTSRGLLATAIVNASRQTSSPAPKFGAGRLQLGATTGSISWAAELGSAWTVVAYWNFGNTAWNHYVWTSGGRGWLDGVRDDGGVDFLEDDGYLSVAAGVLTLANPTGIGVAVDDLGMLPYELPDGSTWPAAFFARAAALPGLPELDADGDMIPGGPVTVRGSALRSSYLQGDGGGAMVSNLKPLDLSLAEV